MPRSPRHMTAALGALVLALLLLAAPAQAGKGVVAEIGSGEFGINSPRGVAVNDTTGDVYVSDSGGHRVRRYSADGAFLSQIGSGTSSATNGNFNTPNGLAVDQSTGALWVQDSGSFRVQVFDPLDGFGTHPFARAIGWDVTVGGTTGFEVCAAADTCKAGVSGAGDGQFAGAAAVSSGMAAIHQASGDVYVSDPGNRRIQRFDRATGAFEVRFGGAATFGSNSPSRIAVDSTGVVLAVDNGSNRVLRCHSLGGGPETFSCTAFATAQLSGQFPFAIAIDSDSGNVFVARRPGGASADPIDIVELEPDGDIVDVHGAGAGIVAPASSTQLPTNSGLAVNSATGRIYLSRSTSSSTQVALRRVIVLDTVPAAPTASSPTVSAVTADSATVEGTVNPGGSPTDVVVEYRAASASAWTRVVVDAGNGVVDEPVSVPLTDLEPSTSYEVRLVADRRYGSERVISASHEFTTAPAAPAVSEPAATASGTTANLRARIDPNGQATVYRFEYGTTAAYGASTPEREAGDGNVAKRFHEVVEGLAPATTYHYRVVAINPEGESASSDQTFTTAAADPSSTGRGYELVTPPDSIADVRWYGGGERPSTPSGDTVCFGSIWPLGGEPASGGTQVEDVHCSHRGADGWATEAVAMPRGAPGVPVAASGAVLRWTSPDGAKALFTSDFKSIDPDRPIAGFEDIQVETYLRAGGETVWVSRVDSFGVGEAARQALDASTELDRVLYSDPISGRLLEWTPAGVRAVAVDEGGTERSGHANVDGTGSGAWGLRGVPGSMSRDGSRIFFQSSDQLVADEDGTGQDVYVREGGATTRIVSPRRGAAGALTASFVGASDDGDIAYVTATGALTGAATSGLALYRYTLSEDELELIEDGIGAVLGTSPDGSTVVFRGTDVLAGGEGSSLYVARGGTVVRVIGLTAADQGFSGAHRVAADAVTMRALRFSNDGAAIAFAAEGDTPGLTGVYLWSSADGLELLSADDSGAKVAAAFGNIGHDRLPGSRNAGRGMTDDGEAVYFETDAVLDPRDVNDDTDVYEWRDGELRLITPGRVDGHVRYLDNSADGSTVFFTTYERIRPREDTNAGRDVYAARTGPVFPEPPPGTVGQPPDPREPGIAPGGPAIDSDRDRGREDDEGGRVAKSLAVAKPSRAALRAAARTGRLRVPVRIAGGGRVVVTARARIGGRERVVGRAVRTVAKQGRTTVRIVVRLSRAARARIARGGLRLRIEAKAGARTKRVATVVPRGGAAAADHDSRERG